MRFKRVWTTRPDLGDQPKMPTNFLSKFNINGHILVSCLEAGSKKVLAPPIR